MVNIPEKLTQACEKKVPGRFSPSSCGLGIYEARHDIGRLIITYDFPFFFSRDPTH